MSKREEKEKALKALGECKAKGEKELKLDGLEHKHIHCGMKTKRNQKMNDRARDWKHWNNCFG